MSKCTRRISYEHEREYDSEYKECKPKMAQYQMKANNGTGNNPSRDEWQTPQWLFDTLHKQYRFVFDCCADEHNRKVTGFTIDFLNTKGYKPSRAWMNPPFSKASKMFDYFFKTVKKGVAIYRCDNFETKIWQQVIFPNASWIFIPNKRIAYEGMEGSGSRFPSALIGFNINVPQGIEGTTLLLENEDGGAKK